MARVSGPFEILEILGEGSFGTVCVARVNGDPLRRKVALKILKGAYATNKKILNRTRDEARLLSRINHPNIVRVERLMDVGGRPVVVMELVQGVPLDHLLLRFAEGLPGAAAVEVMRLSCLALQVAYAEATDENDKPLRVIHRDIKPSNLLLSIHGELKVVDFGIAKGEFEGREAKTESVVMGSRPYMAPERLDGISDNPSVDVYSAGMSLFELLTGRTMSLSINPVTHDQAMNRQLGYLQVEGLSKEGHEDLRGIVRRMCAYDRTHRPSAVDAARDLEQILYAIDPRHRVTLEEFAQTTVLPLYSSRPRITPDEALENPEGEFLREVTGQLTGSATAKEKRTSPLVSWTPYVFVGLLGVIVAVLGALSAWKIASQGLGAGAELAARGSVTKVGDDGRVSLKVWIPSDAQAQVADVFMPTPGHIRVYPGPTLMQVMLNDGSQTNCTFVANDGIAVRYVMEGGSGAVSIDDATAMPCIEARARVHPPRDGGVAGG